MVMFLVLKDHKEAVERMKMKSQSELYNIDHLNTYDGRSFLIKDVYSIVYNGVYTTSDKNAKERPYVSISVMRHAQQGETGKNIGQHENVVTMTFYIDCEDLEFLDMLSIDNAFNM